MRRSALGTIPALLEQLVVDPAMILQLGIDEYRRDKDNKLFDRPARLMLDNWTVGAGEYTERDVADLSRALTGWMLVPPKGQDADAADPEAFRSARRTGLVPIFEPAHFEDWPEDDPRDDGELRRALGGSLPRPASGHGAPLQPALIAYFGVDDAESAARNAAGRNLSDDRMARSKRCCGTSCARKSSGRRSRGGRSSRARSIWRSARAGSSGITEPPLAEISRWLVATGQTLFDTPNFGDGGWPGQEAWVTPPDRLAVRYQLGPC